MAEERIYADRPEVYDALNRGKRRFDAEVTFVRQQFEVNRRTDGERVLVVGCGPGRHAVRLARAGFDVVAVDKYPAMVEYARSRVADDDGVDFRVGELPDLDVAGSFDLVLAIYNVLNYLDPDGFEAALGVLADHLADGGVLLFDNQLGVEGDRRMLMDAGTDGDREYARIQQLSGGDDHLLLQSLIFDVTAADCLLDEHALRLHDDARIREILDGLGLSTEVYHGGYGFSMSAETFALDVYVVTRSRRTGPEKAEDGS